MNEHRDEDPQAPDLTGRLPREIALPNDLWPVIEAAIRQETNEADRLLQCVPREVEPPDEVWSNVAAGISARKSGKPGRPRGLWHTLPRLAASIAFVAAATALLLWSGMFDDAGDFVPEQATAESAESAEYWLTAGLWDVGLDSSMQTAASFEAARRTYLEKIAAVRSQREEIELFLALHPDQPALRELWIYVYETELLLIDEAGRVLNTIQTG